jgi:hypothetical protein
VAGIPSETASSDAIMNGMRREIFIDCSFFGIGSNDQQNAGRKIDGKIALNIERFQQ